MNKPGKVSNYDLQAETARTVFLRYDQEILIRRYQLEADKKWIYIKYLHADYRVNRMDGQIDERTGKGIWEKCSDFNTVMTIFDFLCYPKTECAPNVAGKWCTLRSFTMVSNPDSDFFRARYAQAFQNHIEELKQAGIELGGSVVPPVAGSDLTIQIPVTSFFSVLLQFWEADEEFPPQVMLLWDEKATEFLHFETLFYLQGDLLERIWKKIKPCIE